MPKLYKYLGMVILFHSKEHLPVHVHAKYNETEMRVTFYTKDGKISKIIYSKIVGKKELPGTKLKELKKLINQEKNTILALWNDYFVWNKKITTRVITKNDVK